MASIAYVLAALSVVLGSIAVHELAHAAAARIVGIKVRKIYIGLPMYPFILRRVFWKDKEYVFSALIIFGGGVHISDDDYDSLSRRRKLLILAVGPWINISLGIIASILFLGGDTGVEVSREFVNASIQATTQTFFFNVSPLQLVGPIGFVAFLAKVIAIDPTKGLLFSFLLVNFAIGVFNHAPIPPLDGFRMVSALFNMNDEWRAREKKTNVKFAYAFLFVLILLSIKDVYGIFSGQLVM